MKKTGLLVLMVISLGVGCLIGCAPTAPVGTQPSATTDSTVQPLSPTQSPSQSAIENLIGTEDTYWEAVSCYNEETSAPETLVPQEWALDLTIRVDGTARFRDIHEKLSLSDDSLLDLTWEQTAESTYLFYSSLRDEPVLTGRIESGSLTLEYYGLRLTMEQRELPQTVGETYSFAELRGTWLMISGEIEDDKWQAMPGELSSIVFDTTYADDHIMLIADMEERGYDDQMRYSAYEQEVSLLEEPLYHACENEAWSVRIGPASPTDENGYPLETEFYATLLDYNTLLLQRYYTLDGAPTVSYQTYWRFSELVSWSDPEYMELDFSNWVCTSYTNSQREAESPPAEMEGFSVILNPDRTCLVCYSDGTNIQGTWMLSSGGVLLLRGNEDEFWFGGTITHYSQVTDSESCDVYKMSLYYDGGILRLSMESYG